MNLEEKHIKYCTRFRYLHPTGLVGFKRVPTVLPNKPYSINRGEIAETTQVALDKIKTENKENPSLFRSQYP